MLLLYCIMATPTSNITSVAGCFEAHPLRPLQPDPKPSIGGQGGSIDSWFDPIRRQLPVYRADGRHACMVDVCSQRISCGRYNTYVPYLPTYFEEMAGTRFAQFLPTSRCALASHSALPSPTMHEEYSLFTILNITRT